MKGILLAAMLSFGSNLLAQNGVKVNANEQYFNTRTQVVDQAVKLRLLNLLNGSIGVNYEIDLNDKFMLDFGGGLLTSTFNGQPLYADWLTNAPTNYGKGGFFLSIGPTLNLSQDFLGDYWGLRPSYTFYHQSTKDGTNLQLNRLAVEYVLQFSFDHNIFVESSYGVGYQLYVNEPNFFSNSYVFLFNLSVGYLF